MSGHSHWSGIKHRKGLNDAKKASLFTKAGKDITLAAQRGGDPDKNFSLRLAIETARAVNMPKETIERAIKKGTGEILEGTKIEEIVYEGFGPGNAALLVGTATDNKNRTVSEIRSLFTKNNGKLGAVGSVAFLFKKVGALSFPLLSLDREALELALLETNALDFSIAPEELVLYTESGELESVRQKLESLGFKAERAELTFLPLQTVTLNPEEREELHVLLEKLEDHPDIQAVWDNVSL